jgi:hypothetical protein
MKYLYMIITADELELPLAIEPRLKELSKKTGINYHTLRTSFYHGTRILKENCKCVRIENK